MQSPDALDALERFGIALSDPIRRQVLVALIDGPSYPGDLLDLVDTSQPNLSNHLACLRGCGLVTAQREGRRVRYELSSERVAHALADLLDLELPVESGHRHA